MCCKGQLCSRAARTIDKRKTRAAILLLKGANMGNWIGQRRLISDVQIKILLLLAGFIAVTAVLIFYTYSISR